MDRGRMADYDEVTCVRLSEAESGEWVERMVDIYMSAEAVRAQDTRTQTETPTQQTGGRTGSGGSRWAVVCVGLLCVLLLITNITLYMYHIHMKEIKDRTVLSLSGERETLLSSFRNLTEERDQLQSSYQNLTEERDQLQSSYQNLTVENKKMKNKSQSLAAEVTTLQTRYEERLLKYMCAECSDNCFFKDWRKHKGSFYLISTEYNNWRVARQDCRDRGADLVIINSKEEQSFLSAQYAKRTFWIGLTDEETEGVWKWVDGQPLTQQFWKKDEPNDAGAGEDCAVFTTADKHSQQTWNDISCSGIEDWVCEFNITKCQLNNSNTIRLR